MEASPVPYIKGAILQGALFDPHDATGLVAGVDTAFFVDHKEPVEALRHIRRHREWPLGDLPDGCEYLLVFQGRSKFRSTTRE
jgi:hypothetical protein